MSKRYLKSEEFFRLAIKKIPLASQTFSKSITQYPFGASPLFIESAKGAKVIDIDGNAFIDIVASLGAITIGYSDPGQNKAVRRQLRKGSIFSLPSRLEYEVADLISQIIPSAERVRFFKNGTDSTSGAIRLARAYTSRKHLITCGYHGWQDWYVAGTSKDLGVPKILKSFVHNVSYGEISEIERAIDNLKDDVAAIIIEPFTRNLPSLDYLSSLRRICTQKGIILIFDETVTGFRVSINGAQGLTGITPDLSCFGKGIANGYPLSALVGKKEIMELMSEVFLSGTFGGDTISLAAAKYTIEKYLKNDVAGALSRKGLYFKEQLNKSMSESSKEIFSLTGHPSWLFHNWRLPNEIDLNVIKTYFLQEILKKGVLALSTINVMYALTDKQIETCVFVYSNVINELSNNLNQDWAMNRLECEPIRPLFTIRNN
jgi:glutamate-1-semialdehyde aminotransferase